MFRVRDSVGRGELCPHARAFPTVTTQGDRRTSHAHRLVALATLGSVLGAAVTIGTISLVQAEDDAGVRAFHLQEAANRRGERLPQASAYAPARNIWELPLSRTAPNGRIAHPPVVLNPFRPGPAPARAQRQPARQAAASLPPGGARTICVRLCDGFHAPIGFVNASSDLKAHDAICRAMNPGIPVKVFRVSAGATSIDGAIAADGKTYGSLPIAYGHEKSSHSACRPPIVARGEYRVSLLRDITLRPGDSVVLAGKVKTFTGSSQWPYSERDFVDFRTARELGPAARRSIDEQVGVSRGEAQMQAFRRQMRTREASLRDDNLMSDAIQLRGSIDPRQRGSVRVIAGPSFPMRP